VGAFLHNVIAETGTPCRATEKGCRFLAGEVGEIIFVSLLGALIVLALVAYVGMRWNRGPGARPMRALLGERNAAKPRKPDPFGDSD
jgi:hypothetical protein